MRECDIQGLAAAMRTSPLDDPDALVALGIPLPNLERLEAAVLNDLSNGAPYGISWWENSIPTGTKIAISDQLISCIQSISQNLIESQLHWLEFLDWTERANELGLSGNRNALAIIAPKSKSMNQVGVIRSLCSSLDCLAGAIIVITALDMNVMKASFLNVKSRLKKVYKSRIDESNCTRILQATFCKEFHKLIESSGPTGWIEWMLHYRNMVVHRGRRIEFGQFVPNREITAPNVFEELRKINHLPTDPNRSDVEDFSDHKFLDRSLLSEDSQTTINGLIKSTINLTEATSDLLLHIWKKRRKSPSEVLQPGSQWGDTAERIGFLGYKPKEYEIPRKGAHLLAHPIIGRRLRAASLDDESRSQWKTFKANTLHSNVRRADSGLPQVPTSGQRSTRGNRGRAYSPLVRARLAVAATRLGPFFKNLIVRPMFRLRAVLHRWHTCRNSTDGGTRRSRRG